MYLKISKNIDWNCEYVQKVKKSLEKTVVLCYNVLVTLYGQNIFVP